MSMPMKAMHMKVYCNLSYTRSPASKAFLGSFYHFIFISSSEGAKKSPQLQSECCEAIHQFLFLSILKLVNITHYLAQKL